MEKTCLRGDMVEVKGELMEKDEYIRRRGDGPKYPEGFEKSIDQLGKCPEPKEPTDDGFGM